MTIEIETKRLSAALADLSRVIIKKSTVPALGHVFFDGSGISATDLDVTLRVNVGAPDHAPFIAPLVGLQKAIKGADKGSLAMITPDGDMVRIECDGMTTTTPTEPLADYPRLVDPTGESQVWEFDAGLLWAILGYMAPCISTEETRYYLNGVCLKARDGALDVVATDGHKLALYRTWLGCAVLEKIAPEGVILPHKAVKVALTMLTKTTGQVRVTIHTKRVRIQADDWSLDSKVIDGTFPDYRRVIPVASDNLARMDRATALKAIERVAATSDDRYPAVKLDIGDDQARVSVKSGGRHSEMCFPCKSKGRISAGFNVNYLIHLIGVAPGDEVVIDQSGSDNPARITCPIDDRLVFVVMPLRW